jgi:protein TonB
VADRSKDGRSEAGTGKGSGSATSGAGNAATSNYTGIVTEHIRRNRRSNAVGAGEAILKIAINGNGQVRDLDIYRSSGSTRFDRQALRMARIAAPYPEPPAGQGPVLVRIRGR